MQVVPASTALVIRRRDDPKIYKESTFFYELAKYMNEKFSLNMIRKEMCKDGHLVIAGAYYVRDKNNEFCYYDPDYEMRDICKAYNDGKQIVLARRFLKNVSKERKDEINAKIEECMK